MEQLRHDGRCDLVDFLMDECGAVLRHPLAEAYELRRGSAFVGYEIEGDPLGVRVTRHGNEWIIDPFEVEDALPSEDDVCECCGGLGWVDVGDGETGPTLVRCCG